jgi:hypothetical protein
MNWTDKQKTHTGELLGAPSLPSGWVDAWKNVHPENSWANQGCTFDGRNNAMLGSSFRSRLDRVFCNLVNFRVSNARIVGTEPIPGLMHTFIRATISEPFEKIRTAPVLPSDHFGLVVEFAPLDINASQATSGELQVERSHESPTVPPRTKELYKAAVKAGIMRGSDWYVDQTVVENLTVVYDGAQGHFDRRRKPWLTIRRCIDAYKTGDATKFDELKQAVRDAKDKLTEEAQLLAAQDCVSQEMALGMMEAAEAMGTLLDCMSGEY